MTQNWFAVVMADFGETALEGRPHLSTVTLVSMHAKEYRLVLASGNIRPCGKGQQNSSRDTYTNPIARRHGS